jgi:anhydro-N-acetylmuramic acid kinase
VAYLIGLMSGTSLDGVDAVLAHIDGTQLKVLAHSHTPFEPTLRAELLALNTPGLDELHRAALAANALSRVYAGLVHTLLAQSGLQTQSIQAIGAHGQTVRHRPGEFDATGYTQQLNNPALLAELTGITVVADFRSRDVAAGGQGAPLVPAFHQAIFAQTGQTVAVLNVGGMANLSVISDASVRGWDCGPGNALMDAWCEQHTGAAYDQDGNWAASGTLSQELLSKLQRTAYFDAQPPKSTGRDMFHMAWLHAHLDALKQDGVNLMPQDVQATLCELSAWACAKDVRAHAAGAKQLAVCGGGALNGHFMQRLAEHLPEVEVLRTDAWGLPVMQVEAAAFAWLAHKTLRGEPANLPKATGAQGARVLGAIYPA